MIDRVPDDVHQGIGDLVEDAPVELDVGPLHPEVDLLLEVAREIPDQPREGADRPLDRDQAHVHHRVLEARRHLVKLVQPVVGPVDRLPELDPAGHQLFDHPVEVVELVDVDPDRADLARREVRPAALAAVGVVARVGVCPVAVLAAVGVVAGSLRGLAPVLGRRPTDGRGGRHLARRLERRDRGVRVGRRDRGLEAVLERAVLDALARRLGPDDLVFGPGRLERQHRVHARHLRLGERHRDAVVAVEGRAVVGRAVAGRVVVEDRPERPHPVLDGALDPARSPDLRDDGLDPVDAREHLVHERRGGLDLAPPDRVEQVLDRVGEVGGVVIAHRAEVALQGVGGPEDPVDRLLVVRFVLQRQEGVVQLSDARLALAHERVEVVVAHRPRCSPTAVATRPAGTTRSTAPVSTAARGIP